MRTNSAGLTRRLAIVVATVMGLALGLPAGPAAASCPLTDPLCRTPISTTIPWKATFIGQSVPTMMMPGQAYDVSVTMRNSGTAAWSTSQAYRLGSQGPQDNSRWGLGRVAMPVSYVAPGQSVTFRFRVTAPSAAGCYTFQWRMLQENVRWFGDYTKDTWVPVGYPEACYIG